MTNNELLQKCLTLSSNIKSLRKEFICLLPEVNRRGLYRKADCRSIFEFAAKLAGISNVTVRKILYLNFKLHKFPALQSLFLNGEVEWSKMYIVATIANSENAEFLRAKAQTLSRSALEILAKEYKAKTMPNNFVNKKLEYLNMELSKENILKLKILKNRLSKNAPASWDDCISYLLNNIHQDKPAARKFEPIKNGSRHIQAAQKRELESKHKGKCAVPNCKNPAEVLHHKTPYAISQNHKSVVPICKAHHDLIHHSAYNNETEYSLTFNKKDNIINRKYQLHKRL